MLLSAVSWTGMGGDEQWTTPGNWSTGMLPGPADDVTINVAANPTIILGSGAQSINSLDAVNSLRINGGSLSLAAGSQISNLNVAGGSLLLGSASQIDNLSLSSGELGGSGNLTLTNLFTWLGGTISLPHTTAQSGIDFHGGGDAFLSGKLTNPIGQTTTLGASGGIFLHLQNGASFINAGTFVGSGDGEIVGDANSGNTFSNTGTFNVAEASGHSFILGNSVTFNDSGTVNVQSGNLAFSSGGTVSGAITVASGATVSLQNALTWSTGAALSGPGSLTVNAPGSTNDLTPVQLTSAGRSTL